MIVPVLFVLRRSLEETEAFLARTHHPRFAEFFPIVGRQLALVLGGMGLLVMTTVSFYLITVYTPDFGTTVLNLTDADSLIVTLCVGVSNLFWLPVMGALSDRIGRRPLLLAITAPAIATAYPAMAWLVARPDFGRMLMVELGFPSSTAATTARWSSP